MAADKIHPDGTPPDSNLRNVGMNTEPNRPAVVAAENALSEIKAGQEVRIPVQNLNKADQCLGTSRNPGSYFEDRLRNIDGRSVLCEGFSIREYVAKVRSVDIKKCWPLSESLLDASLKEGRKPSLPPLVRPNYRWWSCQLCLEMFGEHTHYGASVDGHKSLGSLPENNSQNFGHIVEQQLMVSLDTDLDVAPGISQDGQIRTLRTVQISGQEDLSNIAGSEDATENKSERFDNCLAEKHGRNFVAPASIKDRHSEFEAPECISLSDVNAAEVGNVHKRVKADTSNGTRGSKKHSVTKEFDSHTQVKNSILHLMEKEGDLLNDLGNCKKKAKAIRAPDEAADQARAQSVSLESERIKIDNLNPEATKVEGIKHQNFDIGSIESSGVKICPVCKTFTSATITAVNAHMDNCLAEVSKTEKKQIRMRKQKSRTRKKRSIVDICAKAPPVQVSLDYLDNFQMYEDTNESDCSHGMDVNSDLAVDGTANGALKESRKATQTSSETATRDDSSTLKCKRKHTVESHYFIESGKAANGDGQSESLEMKRRRQRIGIISCSLSSKDLKASLKTAKRASSTQRVKTIDRVEHHVKDSSKPVKLRSDSDGEQLNSEQAVSNAKNQQQWSGKFREDITPQPTAEQSATVPLKDLRALECSITDILRGRQNGKLCAKESTGEHPATSDGTGNVSELSGMGDTVSSLNESPLVYTKKLRILGGNECTHQNAGNSGNCKLQAEEGSSEQRDQNLLRRQFKECNNYREVSSINPEKMGGSDHELNAQHGSTTCSKSSLMHSLEDDPLTKSNISSQHEPAKFRIDVVHQTEEETGQHIYSTHNLGDANNSLCLQDVDRPTANSRALPSFENEKLISETTKVTEGLINNTGLNLNQKVSAIPRDSKGRFIRSATMNGEKEGELSYSRWKQADRHKYIKRSKNSVNTSAIHNETDFAMNAALSYARIGKSTPTETFIPVFSSDYPDGGKSLSKYQSVPELNGAVGGQAALSSLVLNHVEAPLFEKTHDLANFFIQKRCSDYGHIGLPLDSQGELIKYIPNTRDGHYDLYRIQNSTAENEPFVTECSKRLPEFNFVESRNASNNISEFERILKMPVDSVLRNSKCPSLQNYSIPCKQADCRHLYSAFKTNQTKPEKAGLVQSSSLDELQREYIGNSQVSTFGSLLSKTDTSSSLNVCMPSTVESGYNGEGKQKSSVFEKIYPEVQSLRKERPAAQPVMRLMGHNFIIGGEIEAGNNLKDYQQGSDNKTPSTSEATLDLSSSDKSNTVHKGHYTACKEGQLYFPYSEPNTLFQHSIRKENISECPQNYWKQMECLDTTSAYHTAENLRRMNSSVPNMKGKRLPTSCVPSEQPLRGQFYSEPTWTVASLFDNPMANTAISPINQLSSNTAANQGDKIAYKYSCNSVTSELGQTERSRSGCNLRGTYFQNAPEHVRDPARLHQNQVYSQNQSSSLVLHAIPKPVSSGCVHPSTVREATSHSGSLPIQSDALQLLQYHSKCKPNLPQWFLNAQKQKEAIERTSYNEKHSHAPVPSSMEMKSTKQFPFPEPEPAFTHALGHPTYFQTASPSHCKTITSSATLTDSAAWTMNGRYSSIDLVERESMKLPKNMTRNTSAISHEKGNVPDIVDLESPERKYPRDGRTGTRKKSLQETTGLHGKGLLQKHEGCTQGTSKQCDLYLTGQKLLKRKGVFHHEINSPNLAANYLKSREMPENDFLDGKGAEIWRVTDSSIQIATGEDSRDRTNCSIRKNANEIFSNASLHSGVPPTCRENGGAFRKAKNNLMESPKNNLMESQFGTSRVGLHGPSTEASLKWAEPMKLSGGAKHILKPPFQNGSAKQSLPVHYTLPFAETTAEGRDKFSWCKQIQ